MKAIDVRTLPALDPGESYVDPNFVLVETVLDKEHEPVTTIEHVSSVDGENRWNVTTLGQAVPLDHAAAREWAVTYAASRDIPLVYERDDTINEPYAAALSPDAISDSLSSSPSK